ncbi:MAG: hypothetical protein WAM14_25160 [Candidatus Nitrosopolaris sp.]
MLIRLQGSFLQTAQKLNHPFSHIDREKLVQAIELNYDKIGYIISAQETAKVKTSSNRNWKYWSRFVALRTFLIIISSLK